MFGKLKEYADILIGVGALIVLVALIDFGAWQWHKVRVLNQSLEAAQLQVDQLQVANRNLTLQLQLAQTLNRVNDAVVTATLEEHAQMTATQQTITSTIQTQIAAVQKKYEPAPGETKTQTHIEAEAREISEIQLDGMWKSFCTAAPPGTRGCTEFTSSRDPVARALASAPIPVLLASTDAASRQNGRPMRATVPEPGSETDEAMHCDCRAGPRDLSGGLPDALSHRGEPLPDDPAGDSVGPDG
ncbi:hypothetical protein [Paraburkholderia adhaesiva]|uniref:hypothetical protein n=1 Tax=Paraburkholderia adhaesiva TaxID=2883244 RepID=UPI001F1FDAA7|nr:hypothetical protein [Paraburkholderia adhaesiva]